MLSRSHWSRRARTTSRSRQTRARYLWNGAVLDYLEGRSLLSSGVTAIGHVFERPGAAIVVEPGQNVGAPLAAFQVGQPEPGPGAVPAQHGKSPLGPLDNS